MIPTLFLISPARCGGERAAQLARSRTSALGRQLHDHAAPIGDVFAWLSALYFRGGSPTRAASPRRPPADPVR